MRSKVGIRKSPLLVWQGSLGFWAHQASPGPSFFFCLPCLQGCLVSIGSLCDNCFTRSHQHTNLYRDMYMYVIAPIFSHKHARTHMWFGDGVSTQLIISPSCKQCFNPETVEGKEPCERPSGISKGMTENSKIGQGIFLGLGIGPISTMYIGDIDIHRASKIGPGRPDM